jgi:serine/threonine protein kinase
MGIVYEAWDRVRGHRIACKTLKHLTPAALLRFKGEFRSLQGLTHPNLVSLGELFEADGQWFFTMELVPGVDFLEYTKLARLVRSTGDPHTAAMSLSPGIAPTALPLGAPGFELAATEVSDVPFDRAGEDRLRGCLAQLARGLLALHRAGKVHRDVKPSNIRVTPEGRVVVLDFGLVTDVDRLEGTPYTVAGTIEYMAPEQASGATVGPAADWYSVGVILYEALTGNLPFVGDASDILRMKQSGNPTAPQKIPGGVAPDLEAICLALLRSDPAVRPDGLEVLERVGRRERGERSGAGAKPKSRTAPGGLYPPSRESTTLFLGRTNELATLGDAMAAASTTSVTVLVLGESGVGKSALVREFLNRFGANALVLRGQCSPRETVPYQALDGALDAIAGHLESLSDAERLGLLPGGSEELARVFPAFEPFASSEPLGQAKSADVQTQRSALFSAVRDLLAALARRQPVILALDDLQWADGDSVALLTAVLREPGVRGLLTVAPVRVGEAGDPAMQAAPELPGLVRRIHLDRLPQPDAVRLASALLERAGSHDADAGALAERAGGHPLLLAESVRRAVADGGAGDGEGAGLDEALRERIDRLDDRLRLILELVSIATAPVDRRTIAVASAEDDDTCAQAIAELRLGHLLKSSIYAPGDAVEPFHDRVREVLQRALGDTAKIRHRAMAEALEAVAPGGQGQGQGNDAVEARAIHWFAAGEPAKALPSAIKAAERAEQALAFGHAARLWQRCVDGASNRDERRRLAVRLAEALASAGRGEQSARAYLLAAEGLTEASAAELHRCAAEELIHHGLVEEGGALLEKVHSSVGISMPKTQKGAVLALGRKATLLRRSAFKARASSRVDEGLLKQLHVCESSTGLEYIDYARGVYLRFLQLELALRTGQRNRVARAFASVAPPYAAMGVRGEDQARLLLARAYAIGREDSDPIVLGMVASAAGFGLGVQRGRWTIARKFCEEAERIFREQCPRERWKLMTVQVWLMRSYAYLGELELLAEFVPLRLRDALARGDRFSASYLCTGECNLVWLIRDDAAGAREAVREALSGWPSHTFYTQHCFGLLAEGRTDLYVGGGAAGLARVDGAWPKLERSSFLHNQLVRIFMTHLRGACALAAAIATGDKGLLRRVQQAARALRREPVPWAHAFAMLLDAGVAEASHDPRATTLYAEAEFAFEAVDMAFHAACARYRRAALAAVDTAASAAAAGKWFSDRGCVCPERLVRAIAPSPRSSEL